jgi:hypothetical protein
MFRFAKNVIFIDKYNVSGIEIVILGWRLKEITSSAGGGLVRPRQWSILISIMRRWSRLEVPGKES